jgi:hypothetical protein
MLLFAKLGKIDPRLGASARSSPTFYSQERELEKYEHFGRGRIR